MRALFAIILLILVATIVAIGFGLVGSPTERSRAAAPTLHEGTVDMSANGPGFEVEAGTRTPGDPAQRASEAVPEALAEADTPAPAPAVEDSQADAPDASEPVAAAP